MQITGSKRAATDEPTQRKLTTAPYSSYQVTHHAGSGLPITQTVYYQSASLTTHARGLPIMRTGLPIAYSKNPVASSSIESPTDTMDVDARTVPATVEKVVKTTASKVKTMPAIVPPAVPAMETTARVDHLAAARTEVIFRSSAPSNFEQNLTPHLFDCDLNQQWSTGGNALTNIIAERVPGSYFGAALYRLPTLFAVELLIKHGSDVNQLNHLHNTPLMSVIQTMTDSNVRDSFNMIEMLLSAGASVRHPCGLHARYVIPDDLFRNYRETVCRMLHKYE